MRGKNEGMNIATVGTSLHKGTDLACILLNLKNGHIVEPDIYNAPCPSTKNKPTMKEFNGILGSPNLFLSSCNMLVDIILYYDTIQLPHSKKNEILEFVEEHDIEELIDKKIFTFDSKKNCNDINNEFKNEEDVASYKTDSRSNLSHLLSQPDMSYDRHILKILKIYPENFWFKNPWNQDSEKAALWLNRLNDGHLKKSLRAIKAMKFVHPDFLIWKDLAKSELKGALNRIDNPYPILEENERELWMTNPVKFLKELATKKLYLLKLKNPSAYEILMNYFDETLLDYSTNKKSFEFSFKLPYSFGLILRDTNKKRGSKEFYDILLDKRKDFRKMRKWILNFDNAISQENYSLCDKYEYEINNITEQFKNFGPCFRRDTTVFSSPIRLILNPKELGYKIINKLDEYVYEKGTERLMYPQRYVMRQLLKSSVDFKKELINCFPNQGKEYFNFLNFTSNINKKYNRVWDFNIET